MAEKTLIANTGIQLIHLHAKIDTDKLRSQKFVYFEDVDLNRKRFWLEELIHIPESDTYARKSELVNLGVLDADGKVKKGAVVKGIRQYQEGQAQVYEVGNIRQIFKSFQEKWLPLPYFKHNYINQDFFGPTDWVRVYLKSVSESEVDLVLAVDTTLASDSTVIHSPELSENPQENKFKLCASEELIMAYFDPLTDGTWVEDYIRPFFTFEEGESQTIHLASYLFLIRFLKTIDDFPIIHILSDQAGLIDVDLAVDIGNSKTCALLFENPNDIKFNLNKVKQLEFIDISSPLLKHTGSFSTRMVFKDPDFGNEISAINQYKKFKWSSMVRIGEEAERLINSEDLDASIRVESKCYNSSPKRYLWDKEPAESGWNFLDNDSDIPLSVYIPGISEQLKSDGSLCEDNIFGTSSTFSKRSLMTFVFLEIITQANRQINSYDFRTNHGNANSRRRLKRILISCPTAMIKEEQIALRQCANEAFIIFNNFMTIIKNEYDKKSYENNLVEIIPSIRDLKFDHNQLEKRVDWIYDEATAAQILYIYGAIQHKFDSNPELFFKLYGKPALKGNQSRSIVVGSLDIGAGTSDLMICKYTYDYMESTTLKPDPVYWESFHYAGDELLKYIIQDIIIEGREESPEDQGCSGVILKYGKNNHIPDIISKINGFFGRNNANIGYKARLMRVSFINQIGLPLAYEYLSCANKKQDESRIATYEEIFKLKKPNKHLLDFFEAHFGFRFEDLVWNLSPGKVNKIIASTFSKIFEQISKIMHLYECDIIILSGRPFSLNSLEQQFMKFHPVNPNRLVNLNKYWVGKWYPFTDNHGYINDPKTVVTVGSLISLMGGKLYKLNNFRIDNTLLKTKLNSTANFLGNWENFIIKKSFMKPNDEETTFMVYDIPFHIGFKNIDSSNYPSRHLYVLQFNNRNIREQLGLDLFLDSTSINDKVEDRKNKLKSRLPYQITIRREFEKDKEKIKIDFMIDSQGSDLSKSNFELKLQTLEQTTGYWLDSGEFNLSIE